MRDEGFEKGSGGIQQSGGDSVSLEKGNEALKTPCFFAAKHAVALHHVRIAGSWNSSDPHLGSRFGRCRHPS